MEQSDYQPTLQAWLDSLSGPSESMDETHDAVDRLYSLLELEKPQVVECRGPMQQIFFPGLVGAMFRAGKDYCSESRFERFALDSVEVHDVWKQMWRESADAIDWERLTPFDEGIGEMLNLRIQRHIDRGFRPRLVDQVDKFLGMEEGEKLENIFTQRLFGPFTGLRAAVIPLEGETH